MKLDAHTAIRLMAVGFPVWNDINVLYVFFLQHQEEEDEKGTIDLRQANVVSFILEI